LRVEINAKGRCRRGEGSDQARCSGICDIDQRHTASLRRDGRHVGVHGKGARPACNWQRRDEGRRGRIENPHHAQESVRIAYEDIGTSSSNGLRVTDSG